VATDIRGKPRIKPFQACRGVLSQTKLNFLWFGCLTFSSLSGPGVRPTGSYRGRKALAQGSVERGLLVRCHLFRVGQTRFSLQVATDIRGKPRIKPFQACRGVLSQTKLNFPWLGALRSRVSQVRV